MTLVNMLKMKIIRRGSNRFIRELFKFSHRSLSSSTDVLTSGDRLKPEYDAVIIGAGHNGLVTAAYLAEANLKVAVLERRHLIGGAAVTEEIILGYKFSRASYVLSLLRPQIYNDLKLRQNGLKVHLRDPNFYTPILGSTKSLLMGSDSKKNYESLAQFSVKDAQTYSKYEKTLDKFATAIEPLLDATPVQSDKLFGISDVIRMWPSLVALSKAGKTLGTDFAEFYEFITAPAAKTLNKWFESEPLKATLATDGVIGAMMSPYSTGSGYVLLHHVMGELEGIKGAWGYAEGGMGAVSNAIARCAKSRGASIFVNQEVTKILVDSSNTATGVALSNGKHIKAKMVLCNTTPNIMYLNLLEQNVLSKKFTDQVKAIDYTSPVTKINVAVDRLPNFIGNPNQGSEPMPHHQCTIHLNSENIDMIHDAYIDAMAGKPSKRPMIEMTIPSSLDHTLAPPGHHVCLLFIQYTPYHLAGGETWNQENKKQFASSVFDNIEEYSPGFKDSIVGYDHLAPPDLEEIFGLTGGNIFHGSMSLDQLYFSRPTPAHCDTRSPVSGLYLCGSGAHPGGGVMGSPGRLAANIALQDWKRGCFT